MENLKTELTNFKENWSAKTNNKVVKMFEDGISELTKNNITKKVLKVGDKVENFILKNAKNVEIELLDVVKNGPAILSWYRGSWCPYCNIQLRHYQQSLLEFSKYSATLVALTPEVPDNSLNIKEINELGFEVLTDYDNQIAKKFGIVFQLSEDLVKIYDDFHKLQKHNGVEGNELPIPATYIIDQNLKIRYAFVDPDYRNRASIDEIINVLKNI